MRIAVELEHHDLLGQYLKGQVSLDEAVAQLESIAKATGYSTKDVLRYFTVFYQLDAGAYTETAGGKYSLDYVFEFDKDCSRMAFSDAKTKNTPFDVVSPKDKYALL